MREYKYLTDEEVTYYKSLDERHFEFQLDVFIKKSYHHNIKLCDIELDNPFHVLNGDWLGVIYEKLGLYYMDVYVELMNSEYIETKNITESYLAGLSSELNIKYILDERKLDELHLIHMDKTTHLYGADPNCEHEIVRGDNYSGVKCSKCRGWYCS